SLPGAWFSGWPGAGPRCATRAVSGAGDDNMLNAAEICRQIESTGIVAIIRAKSSGELVDVVKALREGGITCIEVTMTTPNALQVIAQARQELGESAAIGVGTVLDAETARAAILAGAQFVVAPI